jgi:hypothetical protein
LESGRLKNPDIAIVEDAAASRRPRLKLYLGDKRYSSYELNLVKAFFRRHPLFKFLSWIFFV